MTVLEMEDKVEDKPLLVEKEVVTATEFGDYNIGEDREKAARLISKGEVVGVFNRGVCALWIDPTKEEAVQRISDIKGEERNNRPMGVTLPSHKFIELIDLESIPSEHREILTSPEEMRERLGSYTFLRARVKPELVSTLPSKIVDRTDEGVGVIQNWDPTGHYPAKHLVDRMMVWGVRYPAITSMNISKQPEITDPAIGKVFSRTHGIPLFLDDPRDQHISIGSYPIIELTPQGLRLVREGNLPTRLLERLIGLPLDDTEAKPAKYPQHEFPADLFDDPSLSTTELRAAIIMYFKGISVDHIKDTISKLEQPKK